MSSHGRPGVTRGRETTLKFCGVKIYYQLFFSFTHHLVGFLSDWQSQCLEDIMVAQTKMLPIRGRWNDDIKLCTTWSFSAAYMKDCFYEHCIIFNFSPSCWKKMELLYISNKRCDNWLRLLEKYVSTLLLAILYAVTTFSRSVFFLLTCFDWWWPCHYLSNS